MYKPVDILWTTCRFKQTCLQIINKHFPSKVTSTRFNQSDRIIPRIVRRKKRAYKKARCTGKKKDRDRYIEIQKTSQQKCRKACHNHVRKMVMEDIKNNKRLDVFVKRKHSYSSSVATLKVNSRKKEF